MGANRKQLVFTPLLVLFLTVGVVQERANADSFMSPDEVRDCICREQALQSLRQENDALQTQLNDARAQVQDLQMKIDNMRKTMNPNDNASIQALSQLISQRDALNNQHRTTIFPQAWTTTSKLNTAVEEYNRLCIERSMRNIDVENARKNPACPPTP